MDSIKLFVADDHQLIREGIIRMLNDVKGIKIVGTASDGKDAYNKIIQLKPDLVLIDISMPGLFGDEVIRFVRKENKKVKFIVITVFDSDLFIYKCFSAGCDGFISKSEGKDEMLNAISKIMAGERYCTKYNSDEALNRLLENFNNKSFQTRNYSDFGFTRRQKEIINMMISGKKNAEIACELTLSIKTVEAHKMNILQKFGLKSINELYTLIINDERIKKMLEK